MPHALNFKLNFFLARNKTDFLVKNGARHLFLLIQVSYHVT